MNTLPDELVILIFEKIHVCSVSQLLISSKKYYQLLRELWLSKINLECVIRHSSNSLLALELINRKQDFVYKQSYGTYFQKLAKIAIKCMPQVALALLQNSISLVRTPGLVHENIEERIFLRNALKYKCYDVVDWLIEEYGHLGLYVRSGDQIIAAKVASKWTNSSIFMLSYQQMGDVLEQVFYNCKFEWHIREIKKLHNYLTGDEVQCSTKFLLHVTLLLAKLLSTDYQE
jgi:hypothetical protein